MILVGMGANLPSRFGPPQNTLQEAVRVLEQLGLLPVALSRPWGSPAWPRSDQPDFVNTVLQVQTTEGPEQTLETLQAVERQFGRQRSLKNAARIIDLDLLAYGEINQRGPPILPHPGIERRGFVLHPLADIAPDWHHPVTGRSVRDLIAALSADQVAWPLEETEAPGAAEEDAALKSRRNDLAGIH